MLADFLDLGVVQGLVLQQPFCDRFKFVAIRQERSPGKFISVVQQFPHLLVNLLGGHFAVVAGTSVALCVRNARSIPGGHSAIQVLPLTESRKGARFVCNSANRAPPCCRPRNFHSNSSAKPPMGFAQDDTSLQSSTILPELPDFISSMASLNCM